MWALNGLLLVAAGTGRLARLRMGLGRRDARLPGHRPDRWRAHAGGHDRPAPGPDPDDRPRYGGPARGDLELGLGCRLWRRGRARPRQRSTRRWQDSSVSPRSCSSPVRSAGATDAGSACSARLGKLGVAAGAGAGRALVALRVRFPRRTRRRRPLQSPHGRQDRGPQTRALARRHRFRGPLAPPAAGLSLGPRRYGSHRRRRTRDQPAFHLGGDVLRQGALVCLARDRRLQGAAWPSWGSRRSEFCCSGEHALPRPRAGHSGCWPVCAPAICWRWPVRAASGVAFATRLRC